MSESRREFIRKSLLVTGAASAKIPIALQTGQVSAAEGDRLVLLGTQGGPFIRSYKQTPSACLIVYNGTSYLVDAGYGVSFKLKDAGINLATLGSIFITHHHSDHNLELGPLLYNNWISGLSKPLPVYAPAGLNALLTAYWESNRIDIETRIKDEGRPDIRNLVSGREISEGVLVKENGMEISCLKNIHPPIENSFAYKFRLGQKTIVFSGDTAYFEPLAEFSANADFLVHEVMYPAAVDEMVKRRPNAANLAASIKSHHTSAENAGKIAEQGKVKNLVLTHFVPPDDKTLTDEVWIKSASVHFHGNIIVGKDLMQLTL